jgi:hypothetical protein
VNQAEIEIVCLSAPLEPSLRPWNMPSSAELSKDPRNHAADKHPMSGVPRPSRDFPVGFRIS